MRRCLEDGDVAGAWRLWAHLAPHLPQPRTPNEAEIIFHRARTEALSVSARKRCYSHRWLEERSLPSGLPDHLRPLADRLYPRVVQAVGISVNARSPFLKPIVPIIQRAMERAVLEADADGKIGNVVHLKSRMGEARDRAIRALGLPVPAKS